MNIWAEKETSCQKFVASQLNRPACMERAVSQEKLTQLVSCASANKRHFNSVSWSRWWHSLLYFCNHLVIITMAIGVQTRATFILRSFTMCQSRWPSTVSTSFILRHEIYWRHSTRCWNFVPSNRSSFWVFGKVRLDIAFILFAYMWHIPKNNIHISAYLFINLFPLSPLIIIIMKCFILLL